MKSNSLLRVVGTCAVFFLAAPGNAQHPSPEESPLVAEAAQLLLEIEEQRAEYRSLREQAGTEEGEERRVVALQMRKVLFGFMRSVEKLVAGVVRQQEEGIDGGSYRQRTHQILWDLDRSIPRFIDTTLSELAELRAAREEAPPEAIPELDQHIQEIESVLDEVFRFYRSHIEHLESMGLGLNAATSNAKERLTARAADLSGRLELADRKRDEARKGSEAVAGDAALEASLRTAQEQLDAVAASLWSTCDVMEDLELETAKYRQALIIATGEITTDILDLDVVTGLLEDAVDGFQRWLERRGPAILGRTGLFVATMTAFWILGILTRRFLARLLGKSGGNTSELARRMIVSIAARSVILVGFFVALSQAGINVTALLAGLGIAGFIVGFALQDTLGNFASGAMILMYHPFDVGDVIEAGGVNGKVDHMNLVSTTILTFDNQTLVIPNSKIWGDVIRNVTSQKSRRVDLSFHLSHDVDLLRAEDLFSTMCREHPSVLEEPEPAIKVHEVTASAVVFIVRPWVKTEDYWPTYWDLNREAKVRLTEAGIAMGATPHTVHIESSA